MSNSNDFWLSRIWNCLDTYEVRDSDYTIAQLQDDIVNHPVDIIKYLVEVIENYQ